MRISDWSSDVCSSYLASVSPVGRTRTAPAESAAVAQMTFAFISCQDWSVNHWAAFDELLAQELDFIVHLGDYVYETVKADFQSGEIGRAVCRERMCQ